MIKIVNDIIPNETVFFCDTIVELMLFLNKEKHFQDVLKIIDDVSYDYQTYNDKYIWLYEGNHIYGTYAVDGYKIIDQLPGVYDFSARSLKSWLNKYGGSFERIMNLKAFI